MNRIITTAVASLFLAVPVQTMAAMPAKTDAAAPAMNVDKSTFVKMAASSNQFEIESSKLAEQKATSADVKSFAKKMIADHTKASKGLMKAANMGDQMPPMSSEDMAMLDSLKKASGSEFQSMYIDMQSKAHTKAIDLFSNYAKNGDDAAVKAFAKKTLPVLKEHKKMVMKLESKK